MSRRILNKIKNVIRIWHLKRNGCTVGKNLNIAKNASIKGFNYIQIGNNVTIEDNVRLKVNNYSANKKEKILIIHDNVFIGYGCVFDVNVSVEINDFCMFGPYCFITDTNHIHKFNDLPFPLNGGKYSPVLIKSNCWFGTHVTILPGTTINENSVIAANGVVTKDIRSNSLNAGVPAVEKKRYHE